MLRHCIIIVCVVVSFSVCVRGQSDKPQTDAVAANSENSDVTAADSLQKAKESGGTLPPLKPLPHQLRKILQGTTALNPPGTVFLDAKRKRVLLHTQVACEDCLLEMLCCTEGTKEHESVLWLRSKAFVVHAALLALGERPGKPAMFSPEFSPPSGPRIDIFVNWVDRDRKLQRADVRSWLRHSVFHYFSQKHPEPPPGVKLPLMELRYDPYNKELLWYGPMSTKQRDHLLTLWDDKPYQQAVRTFYKDSQSRPMTADFVFGGSYQYVNEATGQKQYAAEGGYLICVANFAASLIDVREASSASDGGQSYEAWPGKIPSRDTPVIVELIPVSAPPQPKKQSQAPPRIDADAN
ncbi:MAG: hypothetical protein GY758_23060 [Fuerstiella sp.]|nr:hypothetical protein [Fuerstiella sp.]